MGFRSRIAHGLFGLALMEGIKTGLKLYEHTSVASLGWNAVRFMQPLFPGDTVHVRVRFIGQAGEPQPRSRRGHRSGQPASTSTAPP